MGQFAALRSIFGLFDLSAAPDADHKATQLVLRETERVHRLLKQQKLELDAVLDNMVQGVVMLDAHARIMICNRRYLEIYGLSADVVKPGCTLKALIQHRVEVGHVHGDIDDTVRKIVATLAERRPSTAIAHLTNGRIVSVTTQPMAEGGWVVTHHDVTEERRAAQEADRMQQFLLTVIENVPSTVIVKDARSMRYVLINKAGERFYGMPRAEILGRTARDLFPKISANAIAAQDELLLQLVGGISIGAQMVETPSNGFRHVMARRLAIRDGKGVPQFLLSVIDDLSDRKPAA